MNKNDYNNDYNNYDNYNNYNDYNNYNNSYDDDDSTFEDYENYCKNKKPNFGFFFIIFIIFLLIGGIGVYSFNTISNQIKPIKDNTIQVSKENEEQNEEKNDETKQEEEKEPVKEKEEEVKKEDPTEGMSKEEIEAYEEESDSTLVIGGEVIPITNAGQITQLKENCNDNIEYILGQYFNDLEIGSVDTGKQISEISKEVKDRLSDFDVYVSSKETSSKIAFTVKVNEVSFDKTYKVNVIEVKNVVDELTPEERAKQEEAIKNLKKN